MDTCYISIIGASGNETLFRAVMTPDEEEVKVDPVRDSFCFEISLDGDEITIQFTIENPLTLTNTHKGRLGEEIGMIYQAIIDLAIVQPAEDRSYDHQALDFPYRRIDVKFSNPHFYGPHPDSPPEFEFGLASKGEMKNYSLTCDAILCIGRKPDGGVEVFLIPSDHPVAQNVKLTIPVYNWQKSIYAQFHVPLSRPATELERILFPQQS